MREPTSQHAGEKWSAHGLGHLLNPIDPRQPDRKWIRQFWQDELDRVYGHTPPPRPWLDEAAIGTINVSKPNTLQAFATMNAGKSYAESIKPFSFLITAQLATGAAAPVDGPFQLVAPWTDRPAEWLGSSWVNKNSSDGRSFETTTRAVEDPETQVSIKTIADVLSEYRVHPEPKSLSPDGRRSGWHTEGLLRRRPVKASRIVTIGKEATELDETKAGLVLATDDQTAQFQRPTDMWRAHVRPVLEVMPSAYLRERGDLGSTALKAARAGKAMPHRRHRHQLLMIAADWAGEQLREWGIVPPSLALDRCAAYLQERPNQVATKSCPVDGKPVKNPRATYCSDACRQKAHRDRQRSRKERR